MLSSTSRTYSNNGKGKRRTDNEDDSSDDNDDDVIIIEESQKHATPSYDLNGARSRKKRKAAGGRYTDGGHSRRDSSATPGAPPLKVANLTEEGLMALAIEASLKASRQNSRASTSTSTSTSAANRQQSDNDTEGRGGEEEELQRALKASLLDDVELDEEQHEMDDTPTMEQLRLRRLQRFG